MEKIALDMYFFLVQLLQLLIEIVTASGIRLA